MASNGPVYCSTQAWDQVRNHELGVDVVTFDIPATIRAFDSTLPLSGENVQADLTGLVSFDLHDKTLQKKIKTIQYDTQLYLPGLVAFFHDLGRTYFYFLGAKEDNSDDQFIQLSGVLATQRAGGPTVVAY